jgi:hypothetical protein
MNANAFHIKISTTGNRIRCDSVSSDTAGCKHMFDQDPFLADADSILAGGSSSCPYADAHISSLKDQLLDAHSERIKAQRQLQQWTGNTVARQHSGQATQWPGNTVDRQHSGQATQWTGNTVARQHSGQATQWPGNTVDRQHSGQATQWPGNTVARQHSGEATQWTGNTALHPAFLGVWLRVEDQLEMIITANTATFPSCQDVGPRVINRLAPYVFTSKLSSGGGDSGYALYTLLPSLDQLVKVNYDCSTSSSFSRMWVKKK